MLGTTAGVRGLTSGKLRLGPGESVRCHMHAKNGHQDPFDITLWSEGNQLNGSWQIGVQGGVGV